MLEALFAAMGVGARRVAGVAKKVFADSGYPTGYPGPFPMGSSQGLEAGRFSRRLAGWVPARDHVNTLIQSSGGTARARARYLVRNNAYAANAVECFAANAVGSGIIPSWKPKEKDTETRAEADAEAKNESPLADAGKDLWTAWTDDADAEGLTDLYGLQRRIARELFIAGECFLRRRPRRLTDGLSVPLQLQMLPSEMLDLNYTVWADGTNGAPGNIIRQGIEFDPIGRRVAYHFWKRHPGDTTEAMLGLGERTVVPASEVLHIFDPVEAGQVRGLSRLTPAIVGLWTLDAYDDAELERKKTAALFTAFIKSEADGQIFDKAAEDKARAGDGIANVILQPGTTQVLLPGEELQVAAPADVGPNFEAFQYRALTRFCAAVGLPYAGVTGDLRATNYSSQRAAMIEVRRRLDAFQHGVMVFQSCRPVMRWFLDAAYLAGSLDMPGYDRDPAPYLKTDWIPPKWDWIDPLKDTQAAIISINAGVTSRSAVVASTGIDPDELDEQIAEDQARAARLGIVFAGSASPHSEIAAPPTEDVAGGAAASQPGG